MLSGVALGGVDHQPAVAAPRDTPARKITRLRARAARVQATIDRMHTRIEVLVEDYNEVREALARTRVEQARTRRQVVDARRRLRAAKRVLAKRLWTSYTGGHRRPSASCWPPTASTRSWSRPSTRSRWSGRTGPPSTGSTGCAARSRRSPPSWPSRPSARSA